MKTRLHHETVLQTVLYVDYTTYDTGLYLECSGWGYGRAGVPSSPLP